MKSSAAVDRDPAIVAYLDSIRSIPLLTRSEEHALAIRVSRGDAEARDALVRANLRLVLAVAKRYTRIGHSLMDLTAEGNLGLIRAVEHFDPLAGVKFSTYATWWIRQSIARLLGSSSVVRVPANMQRQVSRWRRAESELSAELGRQPETAEIAAHMGIAGEKVVAILLSLQALNRCDTGEGGSETTIGETVAETFESRDRQADEATEAVVDLLQQSDRPMLNRVICLKYGLGGIRPRTVREIGRELGVSVPVVLDLEAEAIERLRGLAQTS